MKPLETQHWNYYFSKPVSTGIFKFQADDFVVEEDLGYTPCAETAALCCPTVRLAPRRQPPLPPPFQGPENPLSQPLGDAPASRGREVADAEDNGRRGGRRCCR